MIRIKIIGALCVLLLTAGIVGTIWVIQPGNNTQVEVLRDGKVIYRIDLSEITEPETLTLEYDGKINVIYVDSGRIEMQSANCADQTCVKTGTLRSRALPIVCLPHKIIIRFAEADAVLDEDVDAVSR